MEGRAAIGGAPSVLGGQQGNLPRAALSQMVEARQVPPLQRLETADAGNLRPVQLA